MYMKKEEFMRTKIIFETLREKRISLPSCIEKMIQSLKGKHYCLIKKEREKRNNGTGFS